LTLKQPIVAHPVSGTNGVSGPGDVAGRNSPGGVAGRNALVIGAGRGIGRAVAIALAEGGASVLAVARTAPPLEELRDLARARGLSIRIARADASREGRIASLVRSRSGVPSRSSRGGAPDLLVVAAGDYWEGPLVDLTAERWEALSRSNVTLPLQAMREILPGMRRRRYGRIVLFGVAGGDAARAAPRAHGYRAAKIALLTLARSVAQEEAVHGITVNVILPGIIRGSVMPRKGGDLARRIPAGRLGSVREVARAALFLLAEESGYITGAALPVSGGYLI
jgi:3-oxoacyl-[acyl-carrier protein] reductase